MTKSRIKTQRLSKISSVVTGIATIIRINGSAIATNLENKDLKCVSNTNIFILEVHRKIVDL